MKILASGFAAAVALTVCASVNAQEAGNQTEKAPAFNEVDADHNGLITQVEAEKNERLAEMFGQLDTNKDRQLDDREYAQIEQLPQDVSTVE